MILTIFLRTFVTTLFIKKGAEMENLQVASSLPVAIASPLGWNFTLLMSEVWPWRWCNCYFLRGSHEF